MHNFAKNSSQKPLVLIAAGGTGGHIFPALAVADELLLRGADVQWLAAGRMENRIVGERGLPLHTVAFRPPGGGVFSVVGLFRLAVAVLRAVGVVRRLRPAVVFGTGGYASAAGCLAARLCGAPVVVHEQNAVAGRTNKLLALFAAKKLSGFPGVFRGGVCAGNPVRREFFTVAKTARAGALRLLVLGGSQGARALNETVPQAAELLAAAGAGVCIVHQCGAGNEAATAAAYEKSAAGGAAAAGEPGTAGHTVTVREFIDDVAGELAAADVVVCRAGASTLAELSAAGAAALLVPYPHAAADHQMANAEFYAKHNAAAVCAEADLTAEFLAGFLRGARREELAAVGGRCRALAVEHSAAKIAEICLEAGRGR